jgi:hypothetical protein
MKFICLTDFFESCGDENNPPEMLRYYDEIEAESRAKAKYKFIKKHFKTKSFSELPKISVKKYKPKLILENLNENNSFNILDENISEVVGTVKFISDDAKEKYLSTLRKNEVDFEIVEPIDVGFLYGGNLEEEVVTTLSSNTRSVNTTGDIAQALSLASDASQEEILDKISNMKRDIEVLRKKYETSLEKDIPNWFKSIFSV